MNGFLDHALVGAVLAAALGYAIFSLGPRTLRPRLLAGAATLLSRVPAVFGLRRVSQRLATAATIKTEGACGGCDNCGSEQPRTSPHPNSEVRIPLSKIARRH